MYFTKTVPTICKNIVAAAICTAVFANAAFAQTLLTAGGTADAITVTYPANITAAVPGISFTFKAISTNTGPSTLDLNGTGAATIYKNGNFPVQAGDIKAGAFVTVIFDGTDWQMLSVGGNEVGTGNVTGAGAIGNIAYWTSGSNLGQDSNLFWDTANEYLGIGTSSPSGDLSFGPNGAARVIQVEADLSANNGTDLLVQAGGAGVAGLNRTGGNLTLSSGNSTGNVGSRIEFLTPVPGVSGNTSNTITPKMVILGNGNVGIGTGTPAQQLELNNGNLLLSSTATLGSELRFEEGTSTPGDHYTAFRAGDQAVNITYTLPLTAPITGQMLAAGATPTNLTWANAGISGTGTTGGVSFFSNNNTITADGANFFWDNTNKRLGIGTSAPLEALDIFSSTSTNVIDLRSTGSIVRFVNNAGSNYIQSGVNTTAGSSADIFFSNINASNNWMVVKAGGNVGIGTANPGQNLVVVGNTSVTGNSSITGTMVSTNARITSLANGVLSVNGTGNIVLAPAGGGISGSGANGAVNFWTGSNTQSADATNFFWDNSTKRLGINTNVPSYAIAFGGDINREIGMNRSSTANGSTLALIAGGGQAGGTNRGGGSLDLMSGVSTGNANSVIRFLTSFGIVSGVVDNNQTEKMRIDGNGNVGIGTVSPFEQLTIANDVPVSILSMSYVPGVNGASVLRLHKARGTRASPAAILSGDVIGRVNFAGQYGSGAGQYDGGFGIRGEATENFTGATNVGGKLIFTTTQNASGTAIDRMTIDHNGNLGIGILSPSSIFHARGTSPLAIIEANAVSQQSSIVFAETGITRWQIGKQTNNSFFIYDQANSRDAIQITNSTNIILAPSVGNVGIGTTTPNAPLQFANTSPQNRKIVLFDNNNNDHQFFGMGMNTSMLRFQVDNNGSDFGFFNGTGVATSNEIMRIRGNGNVGIGTTAPGTTLNVKGTVGINASFGNGAPRPALSAVPIDGELIGSYNSGADFGFLRISAGGGGTTTAKSFMDIVGFSTIPDMNNTIAFGTSGQERIRISANGQVGIGTKDPIGNLDVYGGSTSAVSLLRTDVSNLRFASVAAGNYIQSGVNTTSGSAADLYFTNINTTNQWMVIKANGNVGIGTIIPNSKVDVAGGSIVIKSGLTNSSVRPAVGFSRIEGEISGYSNTAFNGDDGFLRLSAGGGFTATEKTYIDITGFSTINDMNKNIVFGVNGIERVRITNGGNVGIGTTIPQSKLDVNGGMAIGTYAGVNAAPTNGIIVSGNIGIGTTTPGTRLDIRGTNASGISIARENIFQIAATDASDPLRMLMGVRTNPTLASRFAFIEAVGGGARSLQLQPDAGSVGIGLTTPPSATLDVNGSFAISNTLSISASQSLDDTHFFVVITGGTCSVSLPGAGSARGRIYIIKVTGGTGHNVNPSFIPPNGGGAVNSIGAPGTYRLISDGSNWQAW